MDTLRLFVIAITPGIALALALYLTDRYDREPMRLLLKTFIFGALAAFPTMFVERILMSVNILPGVFSIAFTAFIVAGLTEEFFKREVVLRLVYKHPSFNEKLDGVIYCAFSALGFATFENVLYVVFRFSANPYVGIMRGVLSVPAHMLFAITMGYYLSLSKFSTDTPTRLMYYRKSLLSPVIFHGIFDFILMLNIPLLMLVFVPFVIYMWVVNLKKLNVYYRESGTAYKRT